MTEQHASMMEPKIEGLLDRVDSKFTLVTLAAKRGREINSYFNQLGEGLGSIVPPQVTSVSRKPLSIALEEIGADKITYHPISEEEEAEAAAALAAAQADSAAELAAAQAAAMADIAASGSEAALEVSAIEESEEAETDEPA